MVINKAILLNKQLRLVLGRRDQLISVHNRKQSSAPLDHELL